MSIELATDTDEPSDLAMEIADMLDAIKDCPEAVDPWTAHDLMMRVSNQEQPTKVAVTATSLLYYALQCEELAELGAAIMASIRVGSIGQYHGAITDSASFLAASEIIRRGTESMHNNSAELRSLLKRQFTPVTRADMGMPTNPRVFIPLASAKDIADGAVDVAVTNAGFMLSTGIPPHECYAEVVSSNLSKANPDTGVIDKEPDGKWIKGIKYKEPDLAAILAPRMQTE